SPVGRRSHVPIRRRAPGGNILLSVWERAFSPTLAWAKIGAGSRAKTMVAATKTTTQIPQRLLQSAAICCPPPVKQFAGLDRYLQRAEKRQLQLQFLCSLPRLTQTTSQKTLLLRMKRSIRVIGQSASAQNPPE